MTSDNGFRITPRLVLGLFVVVVGVLFLMRELGIYHSDEIYQYWPLILIAIGLTQILNWGRVGEYCGSGWCGTSGGYVFSVALVGLGVWLLLNNMGIVDVEPWVFVWPLILILVGLSLVLGSRRSRSFEPRIDGETLGGDSAQNRSSGSRAAGPSQVSAFCLMSGSERKVNTADFRGADLTAIMGGCSLDLTQAGMTGDGAVIEVFALMGAVEIKVPRDWSVESKVLPLLGAVADETQPEAARQGAPRLLIKGSAIMGAVEISN